jgi:hypothetical protein
LGKKKKNVEILIKRYPRRRMNDFDQAVEIANNLYVGIGEMWHSVVAKFHEHPNSVGESYLQHAWQSVKLCGMSVLAAGCFAVHAVFPMCFCQTGSGLVLQLHEMALGRRRVLQ